MSGTADVHSAATMDDTVGVEPIATPVRLDSLEDLLSAARELLTDSNLEVGEVAPLICSLLETFVDRFQVFPFDEVSLLLASLERDGYPAQALCDLISRIEQAYEQYHGEALRYPRTQSAMNDEYEGLRQSLKFAAMLGKHECGA